MSTSTSQLSFASTTTFGGVVTVYAPLSTAGPAIAACSTQIYAGGNNGDGRAVAFDPYFHVDVDTEAAVCLPAVVTSWWWQGNQETVTSLGPTFACPSFYYGQSSNLGSGTTQIFCCPTSYTMQSTNPNGIPTSASECYSAVRSSSITLYTSTTDSPYVKGIMTVDPNSYTIYAPHVVGINVDAVSSTSSNTITSSPITAAQSTSSSGSSITSSTSAAATTASHRSALSPGAAAGIGVVGTALLIFAIIAGFFFWRRRKASKAKSQDEAAAMMASYSHFVDKQAPHEAPSDASNQVSEMGSPGVHAHELGSQERPYELAAMVRTRFK